MRFWMLERLGTCLLLLLCPSMPTCLSDYLMSTHLARPSHHFRLRVIVVGK